MSIRLCPVTISNSMRHLIDEANDSSMSFGEYLTSKYDLDDHILTSHVRRSIAKLISIALDAPDFVIRRDGNTITFNCSQCSCITESESSVTTAVDHANMVLSRIGLSTNWVEDRTTDDVLIECNLEVVDCDRLSDFISHIQ